MPIPGTPPERVKFPRVRVEWVHSMAVLPLVTGTDTPVLRNGTKRVGKVTKEVKKLLADMEETMMAADGAGIAAPQVGSDLRMCWALINGKHTALIDVDITERSAEKLVEEEGCLSLPGVPVMVPRSVEIVVKYTDMRGHPQERRLRDYNARVVQHEVDHLDGKLIADYLPSAIPVVSAR